MRFLVDECVGPSVARWLREAGHDVFDAYTEARGMSKVTFFCPNPPILQRFP